MSRNLHSFESNLNTKTYQTECQTGEGDAAESVGVTQRTDRYETTVYETTVEGVPK